MKTSIKIIGLASIFFLSGIFAHAQSIDSALPAPVQYIVSPENPAPDQFVNIEIEGVGQFLGDSQITWRENGQIVSSAQNQETFSFDVGGVGTATRIDITIDSATQGVITKEFVFNPSVVNMVWEADTYTPLLYQGKSLYTAGSNLKVVAYPTVMIGGSLIPTNKLSFQWSDNNTPNTAASGLGKNVFTFQGDQIQSGEDVTVTVYYNNASVGKGEIFIPASQPQVLFYQQDPLRGELLDEALSGNFTLTNQEVTVKAEPYFFAKNSPLQYDWTLDGQETSGPQSAQGLLTLRETGSGSGATTLGVTIQNTDTAALLQQAQAALQIAFGQQSGSVFSSFFGL